LPSKKHIVDTLEGHNYHNVMSQILNFSLSADFLVQRCLKRFKDRTSGVNRKSGLIHRSLIVFIAKKRNNKKLDLVKYIPIIFVIYVIFFYTYDIKLCKIFLKLSENKIDYYLF